MRCCPCFEDPLPIELGSFEAREHDEGVELEWITFAEVNNDYFILQHSIDCRAWRDLATVQGSGNSTNLNVYNYIHRKPVSGNNYYRLVQVDFNGTTDTLPTVHYHYGLAEPMIFPNPNDGKFMLMINQKWEGKQVYLFNSAGQRIAAEIGYSEYKADVVIRDAKSGYYFIEITDGIQVVREKVIIQK
jgi:hypothetical protein